MMLLEKSLTFCFQCYLINHSGYTTDAKCPMLCMFILFSPLYSFILSSFPEKDLTNTG